MRENTYILINEKFNNNEKTKKAIAFLNKAITYIIFVSYFAFLLYVYFAKGERLIYYISVPFFSFVLVSVFRYIFNSKRPYEKYPSINGFENEKKGKSFPSRHTFSAFIISYMMLDYCFILGLIYLVLSLFLAVLRVLKLKHFVKDVLFSFLFASLIYLIMFTILK